MASENVSTEEQLRIILSHVTAAENSLTSAKNLLEPLLRQVVTSKNDEPLRAAKGRTGPRIDSGYTGSVDSTLINTTSVTSVSFDNLQEISERLPNSTSEDPLNVTPSDHELKDIQTAPVLMRSRSEGDYSSIRSAPALIRRSGSEHDDPTHRKESDEENSI